mgnify:FL=1
MKKYLKKFNIRKKVYFIAEIGINHEGNLDLCKRMILEAKKSGADAAKVQIVNAKESYDVNTQSYKEFIKRTLDFSSYKVLRNYAKKIKIDFFATPGDFQSLELIKKLNFSIIKVSSGLMTNSFLLEECFKTGKFLIVSNGIGNLADHRFLKTLIKKYRYKNKICILKCSSEYPSKIENLNLNSITKLINDFNVTIGYSDHSPGIDAVLAAICKGARVVEKHFTLDKKKKGADHKISLMPKEFKFMVERSKNFLKMLGNNDYSLNSSIKNNRKKMLRYLVTKKEIIKGEKLNYKNIYFKRIKNYSGAIDSTIENRKFFNKKLKINLKKNQILKKRMFYD